MKRTAWVCAGIVALAASGPAWAQDDDAGDDAELQALLEVISEETEIATKSKMNSDFVPGIVTVLDGENLRALGARTVWEAMPFIPGVQASLDPTGTPTVTVRGVPFPFNSGSIAILVNGAAIERESAGLNGAALLMPIEQVERIEFVRGPGSVVYGDFAFMGLVNVVTRHDSAAVDAYWDTHGGRGGNMRYAAQGDDWSFAAQVAPWRSDHAVLPLGSNGDDSRLFANLAIARGGFSLALQRVERTVDDNSPAPPPVASAERSWSLDARYERPFGDALTVRLRAQYLANDLTGTISSFAGSQLKSGAEALWTGWSAHTLLAGVEYTDGQIDRASFQPQGPIGLPPPPRRRVDAQPRTVASVYAQDQVALGDALQLTVGARWDDNSEIGQRVTPRAALAWRLAERHIVKLQYAEGFRSPTFFELYTGGPTQPDLDYEVNATTELNYVYQRPGITARATLFHSNIDDMVFARPGQPGFDNVARASADGVELEWSQQLSPSWRIDANATVVDSEDNRNLPLLQTRRIGSAAGWTTNAGLLWSPTGDIVVGAHWNHVGDRSGAPPGESAYDEVDFAFTRRDLFAEGLDLELGVDNALDERITYLFALPGGTAVSRYEDRTWWARLSWSFR